MGHKRLAPSNHRWPHCPGSVREEAAYPDIAGEAAVDGTGTHLLLELCLQQGKNPQDFLDTVIGVNHEDKPQGWSVGQDRIDRCNVCMEYIHRRVEQLNVSHPDCDVHIEAESESNPDKFIGRDDWGGTVDITIRVVNKTGRLIFLEIIDYKDGFVWVDVEKNTQLLSYAIGKAWEDKFFIGATQTTIVQPKTAKPIRSHVYSIGEIRTHFDELAAAARATDDPNAPLIADDKGGKGHCTWCKHKPNCPEQANKSLEVLTIMSDLSQDGTELFEQAGQAIKNVESMDSESLAKLYDAKAGVMEIFDRVKDEIESRIQTGVNVPGYALKPGSATRVWAEEESKIVEILKKKRVSTKDIYPPKLITPPQLEKLKKPSKKVIKQILEDHVVEKAGNTTLQKVAYEKPSVEEMFSSIPANTTEPTQLAEPKTPIVF